MTKKHKDFRYQIFYSGLILLAAAGCTSAVPAAADVFKPPTQPVLQTPAGSISTSDSPPQPTPACQNGLDFLADLTVPDGTLVAPGAVLDKTWQVENSGSCNWNADYSIRNVGGSNLGAETSLPLYPARAGTRADISLRFTAPAESGTIHSAWRAYGPDGQPFGDPFYLQIIVSNSQP
jgi:hypothetical protein